MDFEAFLKNLDKQFDDLSKLNYKTSIIENELFEKFKVFRGLRDSNGVGVVTGLTEISTINSSKIIDGKKVPASGELYYRGIDINDIVNGFYSEDRFGFEETIYLLLFGELPKKRELSSFNKMLYLGLCFICNLL